jgi:predicted RNA-binding protein with PIN domain
MPLHIIIDGYNLIRNSKTLSPLDRQDLQRGRDALVDLLAAYKRIKAHRITVVFDGPDVPHLYPSRDRIKGIDIRYSSAGKSADAVIKQMAAREREKAVVVSSDREVIQAAAAHMATVIDSPAFEAKVTLANQMADKGVQPESESTGWKPTTRKKGPGKRLPKRKRRNRLKTGKL